MKRMFIIIEKVRKRLLSVFKCFFWKIANGKDFKIGKNTYFYPGTHIVIERKGRIIIGDNCFFNCNCSLNSIDEIYVGNDCIFGENVLLYDHNHSFKNIETKIRKQGYNSQKITIGNNCWIGSNVVILCGVTIGDNVVIGAGSVITKNIESNVIVYNEKKLIQKKIGE